MKRSLEKSRSAVRCPPIWARDEREIIPCNAAAVNMGNSYDAPPKEWRTTTHDCEGCGASFEITAAAKQHFHEVLGVFFFVQTRYCPDCGKRHRTHRRVVTRLAEVMPQVELADADPLLLREAVLVITEGTLLRLKPRCGGEGWALSGEGILLTGSALIKRIRQASKSHDDLLPILRHFQERLGNPVRVQRLAAEIVKAKQDRPALGKALDAVEAWLAAPTKRLLERILVIPRI